LKTVEYLLSPEEWGHDALDIVGFIPVIGEIADGINALWYAAEGDYTNAALSGAAIIPVVGDIGGKGFRQGKKLLKGAKALDKLNDARRLYRRTTSTAEAAENIVRSTRKLDDIPALAKTGGEASDSGPLTFVTENLGTPRNAAQRAARDFESGTIGAFSDVATRQRSVPALRFNNPNPNGASVVKFDGFRQLDDGVIELIDAKTRIVPFSTRQGPFISPSVRDALVRKSLAIEQNPGFRAVLEFPTAAARREAQQVLRQLGITNISTRVRT